MPTILRIGFIGGVRNLGRIAFWKSRNFYAVQFLDQIYRAPTRPVQIQTNTSFLNQVFLNSLWAGGGGGVKLLR